jgi:hypothetical protein
MQIKGFYFVPHDVCIIKVREIPRSLGNMGRSWESSYGCIEILGWY